MYIDILSALAMKGQLKLTHLMYKSNVNCSILKEQMESLIKNGLVDERILKKGKKVFVITHRGLTVLKAFHEIKNVFELEEKVTPNL